jgi:DNA-binding GntR family transcriptional regulator
VREVLEIELLRTVIEQRCPVDLARLDSLIEEMAAAIEQGDHRSYLKADEEFHLIICEAAGNRPALDAIKRAWTHVNRLRYLGPGDTSNLRGSLGEHRRLLTAVRRNNSARAEGTVRAHMERARGLLRDLVESLPSVFVAEPGEGAERATPPAASSRG